MILPPLIASLSPLTASRFDSLSPFRRGLRLPATAVEYAQKYRKDPFDETTLYIVHGLLHLLGYDDLNEEDRKKMRKAEARHMRQLKKLRLHLTS